MKKMSASALTSAAVASAVTAVAVTAFFVLKEKGNETADATAVLSENRGSSEGGESPSLAGASGESANVLAAGTIEVSPALLDRSKQIGTLFVMLRSAAGGPPYAVARLQNPRTGEALPFSLTGDNVMAPGVPLPADARLIVRFDADGSAGPEAPGDLVGDVPVDAPGMSGLKVVVDREGTAPK
ncbi:MAG: hypothetical protein IOD12_02370 [Silvanigrellales bacterium]|nr:hypothetical protein [Silvanigrellales bacterium]